MTGRQRTVAGTLALLVALSASLGGAAVVGASHDSAANYTVELPSEQDHYPGDQNQGSASIHHLAALGGVFEGTPSPKGFEYARYLTIGSEDIDFSQCSTENTGAFGLDRGNDDSGTTTDDGLLKHREDSQFNDNGIVVKFFDEGALAGNSVDINAEDEIVAVQNDCYTMPSEPGWYQIHGTLNGTGYNGNFFEVELTSHYFYICECDSEQEAREKLGPPPSEEGEASTPEPTATPAPESTPTPEPKSTATPAPESTPTPESGGDGGESTPEPKSTPTPQSGQSTPAPEGTPGEKQGGQTPEPTQAPGGGGGGGGGNGGNNGGGGGNDAGTQTSGNGNGNGGGGGGQPAGTATGEGPLTPTAGAGPGFGAVAALLGLLGAALLAVRRE